MLIFSQYKQNAVIQLLSFIADPQTLSQLLLELIHHNFFLFFFTTVSPVVSFDGIVAQNLNETDPLQLVCSVTEAWPQPTIAWLLNDSPLQNSSRLRIDTGQNITAASLYVTQSTLTIPSTLPNVDSGTYTCRTNQVLQGAVIPSQSVQARILVQGTNTTSGVLVLQAL